MTTVLRGVIHGKTIELSRETGLPEGQEVTISVQPVAPKLPQGDRLRFSCGAWADDIEDLDAYLDWNRQQRKASRSGPES